MKSTERSLELSNPRRREVLLQATAATPILGCGSKDSRSVLMRARVFTGLTPYHSTGVRIVHGT